MPLDPPREILDDRYEVGDRIGVGGMGEVRAGFDRRLERDVAIKFLRADLAERDEIRDRFEHEARSAARIGHPAAVTVFDSGECHGTSYLVMELLPGRTLADRLADGPLPDAEVVQIGLDVLGALEAAHRLGILHRDVKPGNLLYTDDGRVKLADFGIAKSAEFLDRTATGEVVGTAAYLAPERLHGAAASPASDVYSVGVVLYEALSGQKPFQGETPVAVAYAIHAGEFEPLDNVRPDVDRRLAVAISRSLAKDPDLRFRSAAEMATALRDGDPAPAAAAGSRAATAKMPIAVGAETARLSQPAGARAGGTERFAAADVADASAPRSSGGRSRTIGIAAAGLVMLVVIVIGGVLIMNRGDDEPRDVNVDTSTTTLGSSGAEPLPEALERSLQELERVVGE